MKVLEAAGHRVYAPRGLCCGRTFLTAGMVDEAKCEAAKTQEALAPYAGKGVPILGLEPSCLFSLRDEFPVMGFDRLRGALLLEEFLARESRRQERQHVEPIGLAFETWQISSVQIGRVRFLEQLVQRQAPRDVRIHGTSRHDRTKVAPFVQELIHPLCAASGAGAITAATSITARRERSTRRRIYLISGASNGTPTGVPSARVTLRMRR